MWKTASKFITEAEADENFEEGILDGLKELNLNIHKLTKGQIKEKFTWALAKAKYKGIDVVNYITKVCRDAGLGHLFIEGLKLL